MMIMNSLEMPNIILTILYYIIIWITYKHSTITGTPTLQSLLTHNDNNDNNDILDTFPDTFVDHLNTS